jgi:hypothetical protein
MVKWPFTITPSKYSRCYEELIYNAQIRPKLIGYVERHHVIPKSVGGNNSKSNIVELTAREHYIAHALLWKMKLPSPHSSKMAFAFGTFMNKMATEVRGVHHTYTISSRMYETFRKEYSRILKEKYEREGANFKGKTHSAETKRIIGEKSKLKEFKRGPEHPSWGKKLNISAEIKLKRKQALLEVWNDPEKKEKILQNRKIANQRPEVIAKRKAANDAKVGVKRDPSIMEKCAAAKRGKKEHEIYSPDAILKRKEALKNRVLSDEAKEKMRIGLLKGCKMPKTKKPCPHCGGMFAGNMLKKWHGTNCKKFNPNI